MRDYAAARDRLLELTQLAPFRGAAGRAAVGRHEAEAGARVHARPRAGAHRARRADDRRRSGVAPRVLEAARRSSCRRASRSSWRRRISTKPSAARASRCSTRAGCSRSIGPTRCAPRCRARCSRSSSRDHRRRAAALLETMPGVLDVQMFGERAHVRFDPAAIATARRLVGAAPRRRRLRGKRPADSPIARGRVHRAAGRGAIMKSAALVGLLLVRGRVRLAQPDQSGTALVADTGRRHRSRRARRAIGSREAAARTEMASAVAEQRHAASLPQVTAQAGYTRTNHVEPFGVPVPGATSPIQPHLSRHPRQLPHATRPAVAALQRPAGSPRSSGRPAAKARRPTRRRAHRAGRSVVSRSRAPTGRSSPQSNRSASSSESLAAHGAHLATRAISSPPGSSRRTTCSTVEAQESRQRMLAIQARGNRDVAEAELARLIGVARSAAFNPRRRSRRRRP